MLSLSRLHEIGVVPASLRHINDPKHWRDRAEEARTMAKGFGDPSATATMLRVARQYDQLAQQAEARLKT